MGMDPQQPYGQQPSYGSPPPPPPYGANVPPTPNAGSKWGPTSMGMEAHVAAGLGYIVPIVGIVFFFIEKSNRFVRFHAAQAILLTVGLVGVIVVDILLNIIGFAVTAGDQTGVATTGFSLISCLFSCVTILLWLGIIGLFIWGAIAGFTGKYVKMPVIGNIAESMAGGGPIPAM